MKRRAIVHIGTAKTGSTSIQRLCAENRTVLLANGFAYSRAAGERSHRSLVAVAASPDVGDHFARLTGLGRDQASAVESIRMALTAELNLLPDVVHTVIFSNEHCSQRIHTIEEVLRLKNFLRDYFSEVRVLVYLRRQDEYVVSNYSTRLRHGNFTGSDIFPLSEYRDDSAAPGSRGERSTSNLDTNPGLGINEKNKIGLDWAAMLDIWSSAFGRDQITVRIFDKKFFVEGDLILDFEDACGIPRVLLSESPATNTSLVPEAQEFLRQLNIKRREVAKKDGGLPKIPSAVRRELNVQYSGPGRLPSRAQAKKFFERYRDANERLRVEYFPDRPTVFTEDFSRYPEIPDPLPGEADVLRVALAMLVAVGSDLQADAALASIDSKRGQMKAQRNARQEARVAKRASRRAPSGAATFEPPGSTK